MLALAVFLSFALVTVFAAGLWLLQLSRKPDTLRDVLGVRTVYPDNCLPVEKIESYYELKEQLRAQYRKGKDLLDDRWMASLPTQEKETLKFRLMQRAIGDMAALQKIDIDARGYWRLFSKGIVTREFWNSLVAAEKELSSEVQSVKLEASRIEPSQDPQGIISEAMHFVMRYGDKLPTWADAQSSKDALAELLKHLPSPGGGLPKLPGMPRLPGCLPGMPGLPDMPPGAMPLVGTPPVGMPGMPPGFRPPLQPPAPTSGESDGYKWKQDGEELEVSIAVPLEAVKADIKVIFQPKSVKVLCKGECLVEGQLAGQCSPTDSTWTLSKGRLVVTLEKANPRPWPSLFQQSTS